MGGEALGICQRFGERTMKWVGEMGFGGLLNLSSDLQLPRQLGYWLLSRVDPISKKFISGDGKEYKLSRNQIYWIFGIPNGGWQVPTRKSLTPEMSLKIDHILAKYGKSWESKSKSIGRTYTTTGIHINSIVLDRLEGDWDADEEEEFKTFFLMVALQMVLCPTQSPRLAADLVPALTCARECAKYDWCGLLLNKLMDSVLNFACRFYGSGFASGCGGCTMFLVLFYLDRLNRDPVEWGIFPRVKVWDMKQIKTATKEDRISCTGEYGKLGEM